MSPKPAWSNDPESIRVYEDLMESALEEALDSLHVLHELIVRRDTTVNIVCHGRLHSAIDDVEHIASMVGFTVGEREEEKFEGSKDN